jgi:hypothetical protein
MDDEDSVFPLIHDIAVLEAACPPMLHPLLRYTYCVCRRSPKPW